MTDPFATSSEIVTEPITIVNAPMGTRVDSIGRYKLPLLPSESGPKSVPAGLEPWVPSGIQSMTNLAASISDTKALGRWELEQVLIGLGLEMSLRQHVRHVIEAAAARSTDFSRVKDDPELRAALADIAEQAKNVSGANVARDAGIHWHDRWEFDGQEDELKRLRELLDAADMEVIPELVERTVRNLEVQAAGRFDNILLHRTSGRLLMADLKTKRGAPDGSDPFWGWLEMDAQLAGYAYSELMLYWDTGTIGVSPTYEAGPRELGVDLTEGVILHMPSNGGEPRLRRADLVDGWRALKLAREVCTVRSRGKSAGRKRESWWPVG